MEHTLGKKKQSQSARCSTVGDNFRKSSGNWEIPPARLNSAEVTNSVILFKPSVTESCGKEHGFDFSSLYLSLCLGGCYFAISNSGCSQEAGAVGSSANEPSWLRTVPVTEPAPG